MNSIGRTEVVVQFKINSLRPPSLNIKAKIRTPDTSQRIFNNFADGTKQATTLLKPKIFKLRTAVKPVHQNRKKIKEFLKKSNDRTVPTNMTKLEI